MNVLFATDGSENAQAVENFLRDYPLLPDDVIVVCCVYPHPAASMASAHPFVGGYIESQIETILEAERSHATNAVKHASERLADLGCRVEPLAVEGDPFSKIIEIADTKSCAFIAVGAKGVSGLEEILLGSLSRSLANEAKHNVLVARERATGGKSLSVVFATDFSEASDRVEKNLAAAVNGKFGSVEVVTVITKHDSEKMGSDEKAALQKRLDSSASNLASIAQRTSTKLLVGETRTTLVAHLVESGADLVALGTRAQSAIARLLLGSTSHFVVTRAPCSVLLIHS